jgi:hypothetical protein
VPESHQSKETCLAHLPLLLPLSPNLGEAKLAVGTGWEDQVWRKKDHSLLQMQVGGGGSRWMKLKFCCDYVQQKIAITKPHLFQVLAVGSRVFPWSHLPGFHNTMKLTLQFCRHQAASLTSLTVRIWEGTAFIYKRPASHLTLLRYRKSRQLSNLGPKNSVARVLSFASFFIYKCSWNWFQSVFRKSVKTFRRSYSCFMKFHLLFWPCLCLNSEIQSLGCL